MKLSQTVQKPLKLGGYCKQYYVYFKKLYIRPTEYLSVFCMDLGKTALVSLFGII